MECRSNLGPLVSVEFGSVECVGRIRVSGVGSVNLGSVSFVAGIGVGGFRVVRVWSIKSGLC